MKQSEISQLMMDSYDRCNYLLQELLKSCSHPNQLINCGISPKENNQDQNDQIYLENHQQSTVQDIVNEISQRLLDMIHYNHYIEQNSKQEINHTYNLINLESKSNNETLQIEKLQKELQSIKGKNEEIIEELNKQLQKEQAAKVEAGQILVKMESDYKSMQRKMEIYFKRRIESIQSFIKNLQITYANKKEVDFVGVIKKLDKLRRRRPWRDHGLDLLIEEDKKNLQLRFMEGDEDGTSTPFSNYSGVLTTDYQLPIDSQLEKDLNQGGYLEDLAFNSSSFNNYNSMSIISQLNKKQTKNKVSSSNKLILRKYYDEMISPTKSQLEQINKQDARQFTSNSKNNLASEFNNIQSIPFLLDQSQRPSTLLGLQLSYNQDILKEVEHQIDQEDSLNVSAKEQILLQIYNKEQLINSQILNNPKHVILDDIIRLADQASDIKQQKEFNHLPLDVILQDLSANESNNKNICQDNKNNIRRKSKRKQEQEELNHVQFVNNSYLKIQHLNLSALLEDEIEPIEIQKKDKLNDNSKFSQLLADVSEIKGNISQSKPSFSVQNSFNTPAHIQSNHGKGGEGINSLNNIGNFNNYLQVHASQRGNFLPSQEDEILINDNTPKGFSINFGNITPNQKTPKDYPVSPHLVIKGIINGDAAACVSIYDDRTTKNVVNQQSQANQAVNESNNNFLPVFDESKISKIFSSANNSFDINNESKSNLNLGNNPNNTNNNNNNSKKRENKNKSVKSSKFKDLFLSNSDILNESSLKQDNPQLFNCISLQQIPDKQQQQQQENQVKSSNKLTQDLNIQLLNEDGKSQNINDDVKSKQVESKQINKLSSPNISFLLGDQMNVSEIKKKNNQDEDMQQISGINDCYNHNLNILSRDEKLFNDSKNNLSEFLDQFNSNNEMQKNNINPGNNLNLGNSNGDIQDEAKRHYTNVLDQLSSISDQEFNEQNSLKSPLKETVHLRFDIYENQQCSNFLDLLNCKNEDQEQENLLLSNQNTVSNRNNQVEIEEIENALDCANSNEQTTQRQNSFQKDQEKKLLSLSLCPSPPPKPQRFISLHENSDNNYSLAPEVQSEKQIQLQNLFNENNSIIKLLKNQITNDILLAASNRKERETEQQRSKAPKELNKLTIQKIFSSVTQSSSPIQQLTKNNSVPFLEDDNHNILNYARKQDQSPLKSTIKSNIYLKNGIYTRPTEINYLHKPADMIKSLQSQSPKIERKIKQESPQTPGKMRIQKQGVCQENQQNEDLMSSKKEIISSLTSIGQESSINENKKLSTNMAKPPSYESSYHQYIRKQFNYSNSETKFSEEKQKILHIIQKKLDLVQTREFHPNMQQLNEYKQSKILMGNPFHRRQRNNYNEQQSAISFSQKSSLQSLSNYQTQNQQNSDQNLSQNQQDLPLNIKEKLLQSYSESVVEAAKRKLSSSPSKKLLSQIKQYKIKESPLLHAIQKLRHQAAVESQN